MTAAESEESSIKTIFPGEVHSLHFLLSLSTFTYDGKVGIVTNWLPMCGGYTWINYAGKIAHSSFFSFSVFLVILIRPFPWKSSGIQFLILSILALVCNIITPMILKDDIPPDWLLNYSFHEYVHEKTTIKLGDINWLLYFPRDIISEFSCHV